MDRRVLQEANPAPASANVVVVGAGPTGLFLACELRLAGVNVVVLERSLEPDRTDKAHGTIGLSVRVLDNRGLLERLGRQGLPEAAPVFFYAGMPLSLALLGADNPVTLLQVNHRELEHVLEARAAELGADVRRGWNVTGFSQSEGGVDVVVRTAGEEDRSVTALYLVGCDGGSSIVRRQAGIGFPGSTDEHTVDRSAMIAPSEHVSHGPTLNAAINDAANLGWKLAGAVKGWAPDTLLGTYESERHPVGERVLMLTQAESALMAPGPTSPPSAASSPKCSATPAPSQ